MAWGGSLANAPRACQSDCHSWVRFNRTCFRRGAAHGVSLADAPGRARASGMLLPMCPAAEHGIADDPRDGATSRGSVKDTMGRSRVVLAWAIGFQRCSSALVRNRGGETIRRIMPATRSPVRGPTINEDCSIYTPGASASAASWAIGALREVVVTEKDATVFLLFSPRVTAFGMRCAKKQVRQPAPVTQQGPESPATRGLPRLAWAGHRKHLRGTVNLR